MDFQLIAHSFEKERGRFRESLKSCELIVRKDFPRLKIKQSVRDELLLEGQGFREPKLLPFKSNNYLYNTLKASNSSS